MMPELVSFRKEKDRFFARDPHSPLTSEQKKNFHGLDYFPENLALRFEAAIEEFPQKEQIVMQTSTGDTQTYVRYGRFKFSVDGQPAELTVSVNATDFSSSL